MKLTKLSNSTMVLGLALTITAVGCKTHPEGTRTILGSRQPIRDTTMQPGIPVTPTAGPGEGNSGTPPNPSGSHEGWTANPLPLKEQTVYFDFDKSAIKAKEEAKLEEVANFLKGNPSAAVKVEGNCDERGTEEYNRSLGERRALAAREYLVRLGIDPTRIDTISFGEDHPIDPEHNETAWAKNRRDDFEVLTPPGLP